VQGPQRWAILPGHGDLRSGLETADIAVRNQFILPPHFTARADPKGGVHVHWLLAHCAVFKERMCSVRVPPRASPQSAFGHSHAETEISELWSCDRNHRGAMSRSGVLDVTCGSVGCQLRRRTRRSPAEPGYEGDDSASLATPHAVLLAVPRPEAELRPGPHIVRRPVTPVNRRGVGSSPSQ
jgi:hypothetical protein